MRAGGRPFPFPGALALLLLVLVATGLGVVFGFRWAAAEAALVREGGGGEAEALAAFYRRFSVVGVSAAGLLAAAGLAWFLSRRRPAPEAEEDAAD